MKILITGHQGYIGGFLSRALEHEGHQVHGLDRGDDTSVAGLEALLTKVRPDLVYHLATHFVAHHQTSDVTGLVESNIAFGARLLEAMKISGGGCLVAAGTFWQHFNGEDYSPVSLYAATKQAFQDLLVFYTHFENVRATVLKFSDTFGPADRRKKLFHWMAEAGRPGAPVIEMSGGEQLIDLVYVDDVVDALKTAGERLASGADSGRVSHTGGYRIASGQPRTIREVASVYGQVLGRPLNISFGAKPYRPREMMEPWDMKTCPVLPGWVPRVSLEEGIRRILKSGG